MTSSGDAAGDRAPMGTPDTSGRDHAVVLITADWCAPARPAPTILRELSVRWGGAIETVHLHNPEDQVLTALRVTALPTWLLLRPGDGSAGSDASAAATLRPGSPSAPELAPPDSTDRAAALPEQFQDPDSAPSWPAALRRFMEEGWAEAHRRTGAHPKHVIDDEFGPSASAARSRRD